MFFVEATVPEAERPTPYDRVTLEAEQKTALEASENTIRAVAVPADGRPC